MIVSPPKFITSDQLTDELAAQGFTQAIGLRSVEAPAPPAPPPSVLLTAEVLTDEALPADKEATLSSVVAAHIALRDKTDEEYSVEFQDAVTTAVRRQEIRDITSGLLPREQVRVDNGQPLNPPPPQDDPLEAIRAVPLGSTTDELRDAIVAYLERFGG